ncbi:hypothetical protein Cgig2_029482 [Carnegiea gigantea]|uniref:glutathione-specific gamma-glutamylcyclotransferase n=1 Tax=Carnegiea gigantea TaxID=171969 RepID=A0A9Q1QM37_9CARY|nr:hypothetical protein Cgig2_029482 [Carnegiea gigantea]
MVLWVFGYGSLMWKAGFNYDERFPGFIKGYRRSTDHRGTPENPGRTVTLEPADGEICCGVAYKISKEEDIESAIMHLEVREKQYDQKVHVDFYTGPLDPSMLMHLGDLHTDPTDSTPAVTGVVVVTRSHFLTPIYIASSDKTTNQNYLGPAPLEEIAKQIVRAEGPSGPNRDYLFQLEKALLELGCNDAHVMDLAKEARRILSEELQSS